MTVEVCLSGAPGWSHCAREGLEVWWCGHADVQQTRVEAAEDFVAFAGELLKVGDAGVDSCLRRIDGHFALAVKSNAGTLLATDRVRSIPLIVAKGLNGFAVGAGIDVLKTKLALNCHDALGVLQFAMAGYTLDDRTLYADAAILQPGEWRFIPQEGSMRGSRWYRYRPWQIDTITSDRLEPGQSEAIWRNKLSAANDALFAKLVRSLNGRPVMLPLSGGFDSRLVVSGLHRHGHTNVTCFSYGHAGNFEAGAAKDIAANLGYPWHFIEHDSALMRQTLASADYKLYLRRSDTGAALPFFQDFAAITELRRRQLVPEGAIFINGNSGDFISGNHVPEKIYHAPPIAEWKARAERLATAFSAKHFSQWRDLRSPANAELIAKELFRLMERDIPEDISASYDHAIWEALEFDARQSRFVINGQRIYEHFGHAWRLPLWDNDYLDFWESVPPALKTGQKLYRATLINDNWGNVWRSIPLNPQQRWHLPAHLRMARWLAMILFAPFPRQAWKEFDRRVFAYWLNVLGTSAVRSYRDFLFDRHGARGANSFRIIDCLMAHGVETNRLW